MKNVVAHAVQASQWTISQGEITAVEYRSGRLRIEVNETGSNRALEVRFAEVEGFRVLDERDLPEFWPSCSSPAGGIFEVSAGGWLSQEMERPGCLVAHMNSGLKEYLVTGVNECVSVLTTATPEIILQAFRPHMDTAALIQAFLAGQSIQGLTYAHNDYVRIVEGPHAGTSGSLVSLLALDPEPTFIIELESGTDAEVLQSEVRLASG